VSVTRMPAAMGTSSRLRKTKTDDGGKNGLGRRGAVELLDDRLRQASAGQGKQGLDVFAAQEV